MRLGLYFLNFLPFQRLITMKKRSLLSGILLLSGTLFGCAQTSENYSHSQTFQKMKQTAVTTLQTQTVDTATFGAGCFWCTEAQFQQLKGVEKVESGYSGGTVANPTYKQVCTGTTGHAEVTRIVYDPTVISYDELLAAFWQTHDPTQLNRQGADVGTQYRSVIFYHDADQKQKAEAYKKALNDEKAFSGPVVTEIAPEAPFYKAEDYHQNYYNENGSQPYCQMVVRPKLDKFKKVFAEKLKK
jgi:peptide-methionine (S)-S-oxide reductase